MDDIKPWLSVLATALVAGLTGYIGIRVGLAVMEERFRNLKEAFTEIVREFKLQIKDLRDDTDELIVKVNGLQDFKGPHGKGTGETSS